MISRNSKIFFLALASLTVASIGVNFYTSVLRKDFLIFTTEEQLPNTPSLTDLFIRD